MKKGYYIAGGLLLAGAAAVLYVVNKKNQTVNAVRNFSVTPMFYGGVSDMKLSMEGLKLPLAVDVTNRSDQSFRVRLNAFDAYNKNGKCVARSKPNGQVYSIGKHETVRIPVDIVLTTTFLIEFVGIAVLTISDKTADAIKDAFADMEFKIDMTVNEAVNVPLVVSMAGGDVKVSVNGLGLLPAAERKIKPKSDYLHLIAPETELRKKDTYLNGEFDIEPEQTAQWIRKKARAERADTFNLAQSLRADSVRRTCQNVFDFVYNYIKYVPDSDSNEQLRRPLRTLHDQKGDCDCYSLLIASIFENLGIWYKVRITEYANKGYFQHVYIVAIDEHGNEIPCDPVVDECCWEKPYTSKKDF